jgi:hypothetical protein
MTPIRALPAVIAASLLASCGGRGGAPGLYVQPPKDEPQAVVEVRTRYAPVPANRLVEWITLNGDRVRQSAPMPGGYTRQVAVRPGPATWVIDSSFYVVRVGEEEVMVPSSFVCGPNGMVCANAVPVIAEVEHSDPVAVCRASMAHRVDAGERYVLDFAFLGNGRCQVACFRQRPGAAPDAAEPCQALASPGKSP